MGWGITPSTRLKNLVATRRYPELFPLCNRFEIGDEFHYLLKCTHSSLSHIGGIFLESLYSINSNFTNRVFSHDVTAAILVSENNETAVMLVSQTNPVGVELLSYANAFFCSYKFAWTLATWVKTLYMSCKALFLYINCLFTMKTS